MTAPQALTYDSLVTDIANYCERSDEAFLSQVDRFIMLGEQRISIEARGLGFLRVVESKFTANNPNLEKPERWRQTKSISYVNSQGELTYLKPRKYEYCRVYAAGQTAGDPQFYADTDYDHLYLAVTPASAMSFELSYYERPVPLSKDNQTNWTTRNAPQLLLYGCLLEAQPFLKNNVMLPVWQAQYAEIIASLQKEGATRDHDATEAQK